MWSQRNSDKQWSTTAQSRFRSFLVGAAVFALPQTLTPLAYLVPWLGRAIETSDWTVVRIAVWWFQVRSAGTGHRQNLCINVSSVKPDCQTF